MRMPPAHALRLATVTLVKLKIQGDANRNAASTSFATSNHASLRHLYFMVRSSFLEVV